VNLTFHHLGLACADLDREARKWRALGYADEGAVFEDAAQGIRGLFLTGPGPRLELLADLEGRRTVAGFVERGVSIYHQGFLTPDLDASLESFRSLGAKVLRPPTPAVAFAGRPIAFLAMDRVTIIELIQSE
jgi:methylmalonyl-CoA/ethylmalonyl-CoA epimerase